jgi:hypothetical protein
MTSSSEDMQRLHTRELDMLRQILLRISKEDLEQQLHRCGQVLCREYTEPEPVFVDLLRSPGIDSSMAGLYDNPICRTCPPGYIGWRNRFLGIDSWTT